MYNVTETKNFPQGLEARSGKLAFGNAVARNGGPFDREEMAGRDAEMRGGHFKEEEEEGGKDKDMEI